MNSLGNIIKKLREERALPLRTVAAFLDIDQAILSKMERGQRKPPRELVVKLAGYFKVKENDLIIAWLSDKILYELEDEELALKALQVAEEKIAYESKIRHRSDKPSGRKIINRQIQRYFKMQNSVSRAWIFGSFARGEDNSNSDIDILIDVPAEKKFTLFDIAEVQQQLQQELHKKVDVVMLSGLKPAIKKRIENEMQLIYEAG